MQFLSSLKQWWAERKAQQIDYDYALERVKRGASYLDDIDPVWYRQVNAETLELSSGGSCILGQLHGDFKLGLSRAQVVDLSSAPRANLSPVHLGFHCVYGVSEEDQERDYRLLNKAWQQVVRSRQERDPEWPLVSPSGGVTLAGGTRDETSNQQMEIA